MERSGKKKKVLSHDALPHDTLQRELGVSEQM